MATAAAVMAGGRYAHAQGRIVAQTSAWRGATPEIHFVKSIDNTRLVKVADTERNREMLQFTCACVVLFVLALAYMWQHYSAIEYGYQIQAQKSERDRLLEVNRTLRLEEASLRDPERIDALARGMGMIAPQPGQVIQLDAPANEPSGAVLAQVSQAVVVPATQ
ncbi:MAG: cell division protein FtsL [Candidatus Koribacter versatilis]|uniref:Cell division protein FtsL n=1 Tax=Candidatus Korobacter versatilis TaxID=658062 RepID=A0A932EQ35_9BACT|nr:cell division protein FtsL [Candidatus Koribacter versatilis]